MNAIRITRGTLRRWHCVQVTLFPITTSLAKLSNISFPWIIKREEFTWPFCWEEQKSLWQQGFIHMTKDSAFYYLNSSSILRIQFVEQWHCHCRFSPTQASEFHWCILKSSSTPVFENAGLYFHQILPAQPKRDPGTSPCCRGGQNKQQPQNSRLTDLLQIHRKIRTACGQPKQFLRLKTLVPVVYPQEVHPAKQGKNKDYQVK